jgi:hypothetical protein
METLNDDDEAMMAMMGMTGFGSTKVISLKILPLFSLTTNPLSGSTC